MGRGGARPPDRQMSSRIQSPRRRRISVAGQPRLPMSFPSAGLAGHAQPEGSTPCTAAFDSDEWLYSVEWEGSRALLMADRDGSLRLQGEMGSLDERFPEIIAAGPLAEPGPAVIDGSVCVLDAEGRPDLSALFTRVSEGTVGRPAAVFLATDLLSVGGESMTRRPITERLGRLKQVIPPDSRLQVPDHVAGHGRALATAAAARGLSALVARRIQAPYRPGVASPDHLRIPLSERRHAVVAGWFSTPDGVQVVIADWTAGRLGLVGTAPLSSAAATRWLAGSVDVSADLAPVEGATADLGVTWVRPRLVATVDQAPSEQASIGLARFKLVALRDDLNPQWCVRRRPVEPPSSDAHLPLRPFSPTVLSALPIEDAC